MDPVYYRIKVTKPCLEGWDEMTPTEKGRFCQACSREVTDFSVLSDEEIKNFLVQNAGKPACGHFKNSQLERIRVQLPGYFFQKRIPAWQKYLVVLMICFGTMFSLDITFGNNGLYAQTSPVTSVNHSKKKKKGPKKKKKAPQIISTTDFPECINGFIIATPVKEYQNPFLVSVETKNFTGDSANTANISANPIPLDNEKKEKNKKSSFPKLEFTVPAAFAYRTRRRRDNKK